MTEPSVEEKAKAMGHVPKEEWKGDPDKWRPAEEFVSRGENIIPILQDRIKALEQDVNVTIAANKREVEEAKKMAYETAMAQYKKQIQDLEAKEIQAFKDGDAEEFTNIKKEKESLKKPDEPKEAKETAPREAPEMIDWKKKNTWYDSDSELTADADLIGSLIKQKYPRKSFTEILEETAQKIKAMHPTKFENKRREEPGTVEGDTNTQPKSNGKGFNSLPESAKKSYKRLADRFKQKGREYTKDQYAADWHSQG